MLEQDLRSLEGLAWPFVKENSAAEDFSIRDSKIQHQTDCTLKDENSIPISGLKRTSLAITGIKNHELKNCLSVE